MLGLHTLAELLLRLLLLLRLSSATQRSAIVGLVPRSERRSIDLHDSGLRKRVRSDELVVRRMESNDNDTGLAGDALAAPAEGAGLESQASELSVAAAGSDEMDALGTNSSVGWLPTFLEGSAGCLLDTILSAGLRGVELPLLSVVGALGTGGGPLVAGVS